MRVKPVFSDGKVHVLKRQCPTCIFRPGNLMHLEPGRVEDMVQGAGDNGCIPCHSTIQGAATRQAVCRGYYDKHRNSLLQIAERMGYIEEVNLEDIKR